MFRFAALLTLIPALGFAQSHTETGDVLDFRRGPVYPEVYYSNSGDQSSVSVENRRMVLDGVEVIVNIRLGSDKIRGAEVITVEPVDPNVFAEPPEAHVRDGEDVTIWVIIPLS